MSRYHPSIFNDVIGPVMRGPSSSHVAAALRIGRICRDVMGGVLDHVRVDYDVMGSLATTHDGQGSDMGLFSGLLGWEATDDRMVEATAHLAEAGIAMEIRKDAFGHSHPNTYDLVLTGGDHIRSLTAISTGGGMIEVIRVEGFNLSMLGDYFETLVILPDRGVAESLASGIAADEVLIHERADGCCLLQVKGQDFVPRAQLGEQVKDVLHIHPVLPVGARADLAVPFTNCMEMLAWNEGRDLSLWELALEYESARGGIAKETVIGKMRDLVRILEKSISEGIEGTRFNDRILPAQAPLYRDKLSQGGMMQLGLQDQVILSVTALMDVKSAMGVVIAAPTAGACGTLPGTCLGAARVLGKSEDEAVRAMLAAGLIGVFIAEMATFAAEVGGCQAETGSGSGMAAAALVTLMEGTLEQTVGAASMALQNTFGLVCDPVANRVEAPCLGKNVIMAGNAVSCANMALAGFESLIPLDEVIIAMHKVGQAIPCELRCTGKGGLAVTPTALKIEENLKREAS